MLGTVLPKAKRPAMSSSEFTSGVKRNGWRIPTASSHGFFMAIVSIFLESSLKGSSMNIILSLPEMADHGLFPREMSIDTNEDFVIGCRQCVSETPQGFHFRPTFSCFAISGKEQEGGEIFCANPACGARIKYIIRKA